jgi:hypothetical protein
MRPSIVVLGGTTAVLFHAGASKSLAVVDQAGGRVVPLDGKALTLEAVPKLASERVVRFYTELGGTPERLCAKLSYGVEPRDDPSAVHNAYEGHVLFALGPSGWKKEACWVEPPKRTRARPRPPRELDDALLRAPVMRGAEALVWGETPGPPCSCRRAGSTSGRGHTGCHAPPSGRRAKGARRSPATASRAEIRSRDTASRAATRWWCRGGYLVDLEGKVTRLSVLDEQGRALSDVPPRARRARQGAPLGVARGWRLLARRGLGLPWPRGRPRARVAPEAAPRPRTSPRPPPRSVIPTDYSPACTTPFVLLATSTDEPPEAPTRAPGPSSPRACAPGVMASCKTS